MAAFAAVLALAELLLAAEVVVVTDGANAALRAARLPSGAYALEAPNGTAPALCFRE